jgi:hypothetical protein
MTREIRAVRAERKRGLATPAAADPLPEKCESHFRIIFFCATQHRLRTHQHNQGTEK